MSFTTGTRRPFSYGWRLGDFFAGGSRKGDEKFFSDRDSKVGLGEVISRPGKKIHVEGTV